MRILQLGVGSVGEVVARTVAREPEVSTVVLADIDEGRLAEVSPKLPPDKVETRQIDVHDATALREALADVDLVVNGLVPEVNLDVMHACLASGTHYLDMAAAGPRDVVGLHLARELDHRILIGDARQAAQVRDHAQGVGSQVDR